MKRVPLRPGVHCLDGSASVGELHEVGLLLDELLLWPPTDVRPVEWVYETLTARVVVRTTYN